MSESDPDPAHADRIQRLAAAIRRRRKEVGLTQVELARFAGCGPDFLYDLEAGKPTVRLAKVLDVLAILGLELRLADGKQPLSVDDSLLKEPDTPPRRVSAARAEKARRAEPGRDAEPGPGGVTGERHP